MKRGRTSRPANWIDFWWVKGGCKPQATSQKERQAAGSWVLFVDGWNWMEMKWNPINKRRDEIEEKEWNEQTNQLEFAFFFVWWMKWIMKKEGNGLIVFVNGARGPPPKEAQQTINWREWMKRNGVEWNEIHLNWIVAARLWAGGHLFFHFTPLLIHKYFKSILLACPIQWKKRAERQAWEAKGEWNENKANVFALFEWNVFGLRSSFINSIHSTPFLLRSEGPQQLKKGELMELSCGSRGRCVFDWLVGYGAGHRPRQLAKKRD